MAFGCPRPPAAARCRLCSRDLCCGAKLYVAVDARDGTVKIGRTIQQPSARLKTYRRQGVQAHFVHVAKAGCYWRSFKREARALAVFGERAENVRGDWFIGEVADAIAAVNKVCRERVE